MREISNALSDAIFTVCNKIINSAKFDKTYKCRVVSKMSDSKYIVIKDNIEHIVTGNGGYKENDIVTILLPENNWNNALIIYPQNTEDLKNINDTLKNLSHFYVNSLGIVSVEIASDASYPIDYVGNISYDDAPSIDLPRNWWHLFYQHHVHLNGHGMQIAYCLNDTTLPPRYRNSIGTTWSSWKQFNVTEV